VQPLPGDPLTFIHEAIQQLLEVHLATFAATGERMFRYLAVIVLCWSGIASALKTASGTGVFSWDRFASLLLFLSFGFTMITYYNAPLPGLGRSFVELLRDQPNAIAAAIGTETVSELTQTAKLVLVRTAIPPTAEFSLTMTSYLVVVALFGGLVAVVYAVLAHGYIAQAVYILLGPIFVPFFICPKLDQMLFWPWLRSLLQYLFYIPIANAAIYFYGRPLIVFLKWYLALPVQSPPLLIVTTVIWAGFAFFGLLKVGRLANDLFAGASGTTSGDVVQLATGTALSGAQAAGGAVTGGPGGGGKAEAAAAA
jgi:hypothetical protein